MIGPDLFGFFAREVADLLSQDEDILPSSIESEAGSMPIRVMENGKVSESIVNPSFVNSLGAALPNLKRELLMALLRQIVSNFTQEVDEMLDPVIRIRQMLSLLRGRKNNSGRKIVLGLRAREGSHKKLKVSASSSLAGIPAQQSMINHGSDKEESWTEDMHPRSLSITNSDKATSDMTKFAHCATTETSQWRRGTNRRKIGNACVLSLGKAKDLSSVGCLKGKLPLQFGKESSEGAGDVNDDFKFLLETENSLQLQETVKKHSDEVSQTLSHMEQQLEELLDTVVSKCRQMTQPEKQQLLKQVKKLHPKNLDRVVEIIKRKEPTESPSSEDVFVDLEKQENVTLWRLYFYIQAVENARKLSAWPIKAQMCETSWTSSENGKDLEEHEKIASSYIPIKCASTPLKA